MNKQRSLGVLVHLYPWQMQLLKASKDRRLFVAPPRRIGRSFMDNVVRKMREAKQ
jgi:hypothetical protein